MRKDVRMLSERTTTHLSVFENQQNDRSGIGYTYYGILL